MKGKTIETDNHRKKGTEYEQRARKYLEQEGMTILEQNFRCAGGEIDLIGKHRGYLVFVEVKYRKTDGKGTPEEAVGIGKQRKICKVADYYRMIKGIPDQSPVRYDVVAFLGEKCTWYKNAFEHCYGRGR